MVQRDGRTWEPAVAAGSVDAAAASDTFVIVTKTGEKGAGRGHVSIQNEKAPQQKGCGNLDLCL